MTISKKLVEQLGGEISVDSEEGKGTKFSFFIITKVKQDPQIEKKPKRDAYTSLELVEKAGTHFIKEEASHSEEVLLTSRFSSLNDVDLGCIQGFVGRDIVSR